MEILEKEVRGIATNNKVDTTKIQEAPLYFDGMTRIGAKRLYNAKQKEFVERYETLNYYNSLPYKQKDYIDLNLNKLEQKMLADPNYKKTYNEE